jgi:hypothetical protein
MPRRLAIVLFTIGIAVAAPFAAGDARAFSVRCVSD